MEKNSLTGNYLILISCSGNWLICSPLYFQVKPILSNVIKPFRFRNNIREEWESFGILQTICPIAKNQCLSWVWQIPSLPNQWPNCTLWWWWFSQTNQKILLKWCNPKKNPTWSFKVANSCYFLTTLWLDGFRSHND